MSQNPSFLNLWAYERKTISIINLKSNFLLKIVKISNNIESIINFQSLKLIKYNFYLFSTKEKT